MHGWEWGHAGGAGFAGGIFMIVFWVAIVAALVLFLVWLVRQTHTGSSAQPSTYAGGAALPGAETARDILDKRFARGEITSEEYSKMKKELGG